MNSDEAATDPIDREVSKIILPNILYEENAKKVSELGNVEIHDHVH